jgi:hypothetical protein
MSELPRLTVAQLDFLQGPCDFPQPNADALVSVFCNGRTPSQAASQCGVDRLWLECAVKQFAKDHNALLKAYFPIEPKRVERD